MFKEGDKEKEAIDDFVKRVLRLTEEISEHHARAILAANELSGLEKAMEILAVFVSMNLMTELTMDMPAMSVSIRLMIDEWTGLIKERFKKEKDAEALLSMMTSFVGEA